MVRFTLMNLLMLDISPNVQQVNSLSSRFKVDEKYDIILCNPPFTGSVEKSDKHDRFLLGTPKKMLLFPELMFDLLTKGGKCCTLVSDGFLFWTYKDAKKIREMLLTECRLDAVVSLPKEVFPSNTSAAILFFTKGEKTENVLFYKMESDGYTLDKKRDFIDGKGDIPDVIQKIREFQDGKAFNDRKSKCFTVAVDEIEKQGWDLSFSKYQQSDYKEVKYEKPAILLKKVEEAEKKVLEYVGALQRNLIPKLEGDTKKED